LQRILKKKLGFVPDTGTVPDEAADRSDGWNSQAVESTKPIDMDGTTPVYSFFGVHYTGDYPEEGRFQSDQIRNI